MVRFQFNPFTKKLDEVSTSGGGGGGSGIQTLTGNNPEAVGPDLSGNVNIIGMGAISVSGDPADNTLTISSGNPFFQWSVQVSPFMAQAQHGYFTDGVATVQVSLPLTPNVGDVFTVAAINGRGWQILNGSTNNNIIFGNILISSAAGSITSTSVGDTIELVCFESNNPNFAWIMIDSIGNFDYTT